MKGTINDVKSKNPWLRNGLQDENRCQGLGLRKLYDYVLSPSVLNIEKTALKISGKLVIDHFTTNQNPESVWLNENDDWKYQLPIFQTLSCTIKWWTSSKLSAVIHSLEWVMIWQGAHISKWRLWNELFWVWKRDEKGILEW